MNDKEKREREYQEFKKAEKEKQKADEERRKAEERETLKRKETYDKAFSQLRVLASTGTLILIFSHELQAIIDDMDEMIINFSSVIKKIPVKDQNDYEDIIAICVNYVGGKRKLLYVPTL